jgi:Mor family transcriptional regulator
MHQHNDIDALVDFTKQTLGIDDHRADRFALDLAKRFGGEYVYVNKGIVKSSRDKEIRAAYNGHNAGKLARLYGLSERHIYNIVS